MNTNESACGVRVVKLLKGPRTQEAMTSGNWVLNNSLPVLEAAMKPTVIYLTEMSTVCQHIQRASQ